MKKLLAIVCSVMMSISLCACSSSSNTGTVSEKTVKDYLENYEELGYDGSEKGMCYILDDGSEHGLAVAVSLTQDQLDRISELDFFSDTYEQDMKTIVEESDTFTVNSLDDYVPDMSQYDKYIGQKLAVLFDEGYMENSSCIGESQSFVGLGNDMYVVTVFVEESISFDQDMNEEFERTLTAKSFEFEGFSSEFYNSLYK